MTWGDIKEKSGLLTCHLVGFYKIDGKNWTTFMAHGADMKELEARKQSIAAKVSGWEFLPA